VTDWRRFLPRRLVRDRRDGAPELLCREAVEMVTAYLDEALAPEARAVLERHLADCAHCSEYFAQIRLVREAAGRVEPEDVPPQARRELMDLFARWQADPESGADADASDG
jgi:anti-sigma factor RsiW